MLVESAQEWSSAAALVQSGSNTEVITTAVEDLQDVSHAAKRPNEEEASGSAAKKANTSATGTMLTRLC